MSETERSESSAGEIKATSAAERWRAIVDEQRHSGLGISAFCRNRSIATSSFFGWRRKLGEGRAAGAKPAAFAAVKVTDAGADFNQPAGIEICLRGGRRLRVLGGFDPELLRQAVRVLEALE
jgi:hypothetical protein